MINKPYHYVFNKNKSMTQENKNNHIFVGILIN